MIDYKKLSIMDVTRHIGITNRIFLLTAFLIHLAIINYSSSEIVENFCLTKECNKTAMGILRNMNTSVSPCHNFYQFVCGKFNENLHERTKNRTSSLIESYLEDTSSDDKNKPFQKAFKLYELCKVQNTTNSQGIIFLREIIDRIGGWPMVEGEKWHEKKWENVVGELSKLNYNSAIFFKVKMAVFWLGLDAIMIEPIHFDLSNHSGLELSQVAIKLGANASRISELSFKSTMTYFEYLNNYTINPYRTTVLTIHQMILKWPSIDWMTYFTGYFSSLSTITIHEYQTVYLHQDYIDRVVEFIERTPKSVIINYVIAHIVEKSLPYIRQEITTKYEMNSDVNAEHSSLLRRKYCAELTTNELPRMVHALLYVNYFDDQIKNDFNNIGEALRNKMGELIHKAAWLDNETKQIFTQTLSNLTYGVWNFGDMTIDEYIGEYNDLKLDKRGFYHSMWSIVTFQQNTLFPKLINSTTFATTPPVFRETINEHIIDVDGQYDFRPNKIDISLGAFLNPFFKNNWPKYINYGGLGHLLAHEIAHGFSSDDVSYYISNHHNLNETTKNEFFDNFDCFIAQYDRILPAMRAPADSTITAEENIAENIGVKLVYLTYKDWMEKNPPEPKLYNLNYTSMQMFWISLAQDQCAYDSKSAVESVVDSHIPEQFRINGAISNNPEFSEAFKCPLGSPMNPVDKCTMW